MKEFVDRNSSGSELQEDQEWIGSRAGACKMHMDRRPSWLEVDLDAVFENAQDIRRSVPASVRIFACVKHNGYGCGAGPVARAAAAGGMDGFAVGNIEDAISIRRAGVRLPVILYPSCLPDAADLVARWDVTISISTLEEIPLWERALPAIQSVFLKVDIGLMRGGAPRGAAVEIAKRIAHSQVLQLAGCYGHLFVTPREESVRRQFDAFVETCARIREAGIAPPVEMVSSSESVLLYPEMDLSGIDPGRLLLGVAPVAEPRRNMKLREVLRALRSRIVLVKQVSELTVDGADNPFDIAGVHTIGILPLGWGDGLPRRLDTPVDVLVRGRRSRLLEPIHFEHVRVDLTGIDGVGPGEIVTFFGQDGNETISRDEISQSIGKAGTEFFGAFNSSLHREYKHTVDFARQYG